jgi:two-component system NtrC family sensor kinase
MAGRSRLTSFLSLLSVRLFLVLSVSILVLFSLYVAVSRHFQLVMLERQVKADAYRSSDLIKQSLLASMLRNERERTYTIIRLMGDEPGVEAIRIYNKQGVIMYSADEAEIGDTVDLRAEACDVCHASAEPLAAVPTEERARIYRQAEGYRVLGLINSIANAEGCWNADCHAHGPEQSVLGVLDVQMSLRELDASVTGTRRRAYAVAVSILVLVTLLTAVIVYRAVHVPTRELRRGTEALAAGHLDVEVTPRRSDELGALAASFNQMARSLQHADAELRDWSRTLEDRVKEKTEALEQAHREMIHVEKSASLGRMAATVAHELNNPLSGILTYAKLVARKLEERLDEGQDRQRLLEHLELIGSEAMRCGNIVRDLLTYARQGSGDFKETHLHELVERAIRLVSHHTALGNIELVKEFGLDDDVVVCQEEQIVQALIALMINAIEAMPDGGRLTLGTQADRADPERRVLLSVSDTGVGVPEEARERIFDPFYSTKEEAKGVGLGLAVVYGIVQRHEGEIAVQSAPGRGATFAIKLPRNPEDQLRLRAQATQGGRSGA